MIGGVFARPGEGQENHLRHEVGDIGAEGDGAGLAPVAGPSREVDEVEGHGDDGGDRHDGEVPVLDVADLVGDHRVEF